MKQVDLASALAAVFQKHGKLTPEILVQEASDPAHPLHERFTWDDAEAAHKYRLDQARGLIRAGGEIKVIEHGVPYVAPAYVRDPNEQQRAQGYIPVASIPVRSQTAKDVLGAEMDRIVDLIERAMAIAVTVGLAQEMGDLHAHAVRVQAAVRA